MIIKAIMGRVASFGFVLTDSSSPMLATLSTRQVLDVDKKGYISADKLRDMMTSMCARALLCVCVCVCVCVWLCVCRYVHTYLLIYMHIYR